MKVYFRLDSYDSDEVQLTGGNGNGGPGDSFTIRDLKIAIKQAYVALLKDVAPGELRVYKNDESPNACLDAYDPIPGNTSPQAPLYVTRVTAQSDQGRPSKQLKLSFPRDKLYSPQEVVPFYMNKPRFVSTMELDQIDITILDEFEREDVHKEQNEDEQEGFHRVAPLALVRCSRGGKTRALTEIAKKIHVLSKDCISRFAGCCVLFVTFNEFSAYHSGLENYDPLTALCRRIAFVASKDFRPKSTAWTEFNEQDFHIGPKDILDWLGDRPAVLLVDELNNLSELAKTDSIAAGEFGNFLKVNFLDKANRYFIFTSHVLGALEYFAHYVDPSGGSIRTVTLQQLPIVEDLATAMQLWEGIKGPREAIYYGLMPSMIHELSGAKDIEGKRKEAVDAYLSTPNENRELEFPSILESLVTGLPSSVPKPLHILLDSYAEGTDKLIRWIPFHLEYLMRRLGTREAFPNSQAYRCLANAMELLCRQQTEAKEEAGDGWEALFVLFLLARAVTSRFQNDGEGEGGHSLLPRHWFENSENTPVVTFDGPLSLSVPYTSCTKWEMLKRGLQLKDEPQISIFYPQHAKFEVYDVIAVYSKDGTIIEKYGYQGKEGKKNSGQPVDEDFTRSFVLKGDTPQKSSIKNKWVIPSENHVEDFFGVSGKQWTPKQWRRLLLTIKADDQENS